MPLKRIPFVKYGEKRKPQAYKGRRVCDCFCGTPLLSDGKAAIIDSEKQFCKPTCRRAYNALALKYY